MRVTKGGITRWVRETRETPQQRAARFFDVQQDFLRKQKRPGKEFEMKRFDARALKILDEDDPRHGTRAGYLAHYRYKFSHDPDHLTCEPCRKANSAKPNYYKTSARAAKTKKRSAA